MYTRNDSTLTLTLNKKTKACSILQIQFKEVLNYKLTSLIRNYINKFKALGFKTYKKIPAPAYTRHIQI